MATSPANPHFHNLSASTRLFSSTFWLLVMCRSFVLVEEGEALITVDNYKTIENPKNNVSSNQNW